MASAMEQPRTVAKPATIRRPFRILDAMILVAATAIGFAASEWLSRETKKWGTSRSGAFSRASGVTIARSAAR